MVELGQAEIRLVGYLTSVCDSWFQFVVLVYHQNRFIRKSHLVGLLLEALRALAVVVLYRGFKPRFSSYHSCS